MTTGALATFPRGIHPHESKELAADAAIEVLSPPAEVNLPLLQHIGAPCKLAVKARETVAVGAVIGEAAGFVSAPIHASVAGTVGREGVATLPNARHVPAVPIKADAEQPLADRALYEDVFGGDWAVGDLAARDPQSIANAARDAGLVGMGGAAFPTHVKLARNEKKPIDHLLLNGCECEPYLTADYRVMVEAPAPVVSGALLAAHACGAKTIVICVEDNKPQAIAALREAAQGTPAQVRVMKTKYPQGGEKQLILAALGRAVPTGGLPLDIGVVVMNVGTAAALARAVLRGKPLTHRVIAVSGRGIATPKNLLAPLGASYGDLVAACGGMTADAARIVAGGPMMGFAIGDLSAPVTKGTSGLTIMTADEVRKSAETSCVRCGRCVDVCPLNLVPTKLALAARANDPDLAERYHINACMECGCCAFACPASLPLVQLIRVGKIQVKNRG